MTQHKSNKTHTKFMQYARNKVAYSSPYNKLNVNSKLDIFPKEVYTREIDTSIRMKNDFKNHYSQMGILLMIMRPNYYRFTWTLLLK